jgi:hypothetical protein
LFGALALGALTGIGLVGWRLIGRNAPGADGPYLILDDEPTIVAGTGLLADEPTAGPAGDLFAPVALKEPKSKPGKAKPTRVAYKRKPKAPGLTDEEVSAVVTPVAEPLMPVEPEPIVEAAPVAEPAPVIAPEPPPVVEPEPVAKPPRRAAPPVVVPEIEDIDLSVPMDLAPDDVSMDIDFGDPET